MLIYFEVMLVSGIVLSLRRPRSSLLLGTLCTVCLGLNGFTTSLPLIHDELSSLSIFWPSFYGVTSFNDFFELLSSKMSMAIEI